MVAMIAGLIGPLDLDCAWEPRPWRKRVRRYTPVWEGTRTRTRRASEVLECTTLRWCCGVVDPTNPGIVSFLFLFAFPLPAVKAEWARGEFPTTFLHEDGYSVPSSGLPWTSEE